MPGSGLIRLRPVLSAVKLQLTELRRLARTAMRARTRTLVGYTKAHPIYTDVLEENPPRGFAGYRSSTVPWLHPLDRWLQSRVRLLHVDAAIPAGALSARLPQVIECEGRPRAEFFETPAIRAVFVESRWAGGDFLANGHATLLRPAPVLPPRPHRTPRADSTLVLLAVGYGALVKGFDVVADVFEELRAEFPLRLVIAGTFPHNSEHYPEITRATVERADVASLERQLRQNSRVDVGPRRRTQLRKLYESADVYLHLSRMETFGYSVLEAMSFALPVVATRINAIPEMVKHQCTGLLCDPGDAEINSQEWKRVILQQAVGATRALLADSEYRRTLGDAGRARVARAFDIETKRSMLAQAYSAALTNRPASGSRSDTRRRAQAAR